jgi:hypothetical protein
VCSDHVIDLWANPNNWCKSKIEDLKLRLPRRGDPSSTSGRATVARRSDRVERRAWGYQRGSRRSMIDGATWRQWGVVVDKVVRWRWMIVDGRGGVEKWCWKSRQDHRPGAYRSRSQVCACLCMFSLSRRCVQVLISVRMCCS